VRSTNLCEVYFGPTIKKEINVKIEEFSKDILGEYDGRNAIKSMIQLQDTGRILTCIDHSYISIWSLDSNKHTGEIHHPYVRVICLSFDKKFLLSLSCSNVMVWDVEKDFKYRHEEFIKNATDMCCLENNILVFTFNRGGIAVAQLSADGWLYVLPSYQSHLGYIMNVKAVSTSQFLVLSNEITLWDTNVDFYNKSDDEPAILKDYKTGHPFFIRNFRASCPSTIEVSKDKSLFYSGGRNSFQSLNEWCIQTGELLRTFDIGISVQTLKVMSTDYIAIELAKYGRDKIDIHHINENNLLIFDLKTFSIARMVESDGARCLEFNDALCRLYVATSCNQIEIWRMS
jgi:WD40 repeat protein